MTNAPNHSTQPDPETAPVIALIRVSTDRQAESGLGLDGQRAAIAGFCAERGLHVARWVTEDGVSGGAELADRPGLLDALASVSELGAAHIVVACHDRLARSVLTAELVHAELARLGASVLSADGSGNEQTAEAELMRRIVGAMAAYERAKIALRTRAALQAKRKRGEALGPAPYGNRPGEAQAQLRLRSLLDAGGRSYVQIAKVMAAEGYVTRHGRPVGKPWVVRAVRRLHPGK